MFSHFLNLFAEFLQLAVQLSDGGGQLLRARIQAGQTAAGLTGTGPPAARLMRTELTRTGLTAAGLMRAGLTGAGLIGTRLVESRLMRGGKPATLRCLQVPLHLLHLALEILRQFMVPGGVQMLGGNGQMLYPPLQILRLAAGLGRLFLRLARARFHFDQPPHYPFGFFRATGGD